MIFTFVIRVILYYIIWTISSNIFGENIIYLNSSLTFLVPFIVENIISTIKIKNKIYKNVGISFIVLGFVILIPAFISISYNTVNIIVHPVLTVNISRNLYWSIIYIYSLSPTIFEFFLSKGEKI